ncbi:PucR family transcriptional regulator ligand-binding domain-containing protein [Enterococcus ureilyticus]|uniref:PucR family transcriptional regulator n=1 Tax=Enterococcus ureilyticus TaxID=1131292 RepID=UPI001A912A30|nr:PucR family transcriptional regulator [Enterococcus ureilyticus]MBO0446127.1 PucR family transcriptional regulator ligand-binding domain-containing protein [Enterococcus ureilyticus]
MLTVEHFLQLAPFKKFQLVAGANGLDNKITGINILDNPDASDWLSAGELLITSGYFFSKNTEIQKQFIQRFKEINCSAICIKPHIYLKGIPQSMRDLADELALPIIEIPYGVAFSKIMNIVMAEISGRMDERNQASLDIHSQFFEISLHGGGMKKIAAELANMVQNPVVLVDTDWSVTAVSDHKQPLIQETIKTIEHTFTFPLQTFNDLPTNFERIQKPITRSLFFADKEYPCVIMPVYFDTIHYGFILVYQIERPLTDLDYVALENGSMAFALEQMRLFEIERTENRIRRDFFDQLLSGQIKDLDTLAAYDTAIDPLLNYTVLILSIQTFGIQTDSLMKKKQAEDRLMKSLLSSLTSYTANRFPHLHLFSRKNQLVMLLGTDPNSSTLKTHNELSDTAERIRMYLEQQGPSEREIFCTIGSTLPILELSQSFEEAKKVIQLLEDDSKEEKIYFFNDFYFDSFLVDSISKDQGQKFYTHYLNTLLTYDKENKTSFTPTLKAYLAHHLNIATTSRALFIHRNTLLYRIEKIKGLLPVELDQEKNTFALQLALKLYDLYH